jgi:hypothetical protein
VIKNSDLLYNLLRSFPADHVNDLYMVEFKIRIKIKIGIRILLHGKLSVLKFLRVWPHRRALYEQSYWTAARERTSVGLVKPRRWPTAHALGSVEHSLQLPGSSSSTGHPVILIPPKRGKRNILRSKRERIHR